MSKNNTSQEVYEINCKNEFYKTKVEQGQRISWCSCGDSTKVPFCDGSHKKNGKGLRSVPYEFQGTEEVLLCGCQQTKTPPFCDGKSDKLKQCEKI